MSKITVEWLEQEYMSDFYLNGKLVNDSESLTKNEVMMMLAGYEINDGSTDEEIDRDLLLQKYNAMLEEFKQSQKSFNEFIDQVKRRVQPTSN